MWRRKDTEGKRHGCGGTLAIQGGEECFEESGCLLSEPFTTEERCGGCSPATGRRASGACIVGELEGGAEGAAEVGEKAIDSFARARENECFERLQR